MQGRGSEPGGRPGRLDARALGLALWVLATLLTCALPASPARAHQTADSRLEVEIRPEANEIDLLALIPSADLAETLKIPLGPEALLDPPELVESAERVIAYLRGSIGARRGGRACLPVGEATLRLGERKRQVLYLETLRCSAERGPVLLHHAALFEQGRYRHLARIQVGDEVTTTVFSPGLARTTIPLKDRPGPAGRALSTAGRFLWEGVLHIWGGIDHILFVICLLIIANRFKGLLGVITAFTVAHTLTLVASAMGAITLTPNFVEPAIAVSILYVALENAWAFWKGREGLATGWRRYGITFVFGLVHGFGFSYVLRDEVGLPTEALLPALLSFNVGVELGQVVVVALAWPALRFLSRTRVWRPFFYGSTAVVVVVAVYWFITRLVAATGLA